MHWRHKQGLERFMRTTARPITFHDTPGVGEATWKTFMENGWITCVDQKPKWWQSGWRISDAGRAALTTDG